MHGRVKVRTSEEEKARKEKERQEKLKVFKHAIQKIQSKRKEKELDKEMLKITENVLSSNPDIYTLWNIRREVLQFCSKSSEFEEEMSKLYNDELQLTEYCLKVNPKSYCAWHQREWVLTTRPDPDWAKELVLCNTYLKLDERNFHTWDYRRFVVSHYKPPLKDEFDYTTEKLHDNFSNYSAWHYRSKMLVELYPDLEGGRPIEDSHHKHELKMVINAAFTDPDDTSAWFYQRWLLGAVKKTIQLVVCTVTNSKATFAFNYPVDKESISTAINVLISNVAVTGEWESCGGYQHDVLWMLKLDKVVTCGINVVVEYGTNSSEKLILNCKEYKPGMYVGKADTDFQKKYSEPVVEELKNQVESCRQLLALEPDSKWTMLTYTFFLYCIDAKLHHEEIVKNLNILKTLDSSRKGYYGDLIAKWSFENQIKEELDKTCLDLKINFSEKVTSLPHLQYYSYCENVDLSSQKLTSNILPSLSVLQHCKKLSLAGNNLTSLSCFPMLDLEELNLKDNPDLNMEELAKLRDQCKYNIIV